MQYSFPDRCNFGVAAVISLQRNSVFRRSHVLGCTLPMLLFRSLQKYTVCRMMNEWTPIFLVRLMNIQTVSSWPYSGYESTLRDTLLLAGHSRIKPSFPEVSCDLVMMPKTPRSAGQYPHAAPIPYTKAGCTEFIVRSRELWFTW